ncbi:ATP synthase subunit I [bacterium]|nr:ATP synthase subunit I [bacterium]
MEHPQNTEIEERVLKRIPREVTILSLLAALGTWFLWNIPTAAFVWAGGIFSSMGFIWLKSATTRFLTLHPRKKALKSGLFLYAIRLALIIVLFFIIIFFFSKKIIAFAFGFSMIIPVFLFEAVWTLSRIKKWKN